MEKYLSKQRQSLWEKWNFEVKEMKEYLFGKKYLPHRSMIALVLGICCWPSVFMILLFGWNHLEPLL